MQNSEKKILSIQALRGVAAVLVVFCHSMQYQSIFSPVHLERYLGYCFGGFGVDIFFVISGFIMVYISTEDFGQNKAMASFLLRRIIRIFPMYWIVALTVLFIIIPSGLYSQIMLEKQQIVVSASHNLKYVIENLLLLPPFYVTKGIIPPIVAVAWTLFLEMFFYIIFGILLIFNRKIFLPTLCSIFVCLILLKFYFLNFNIVNIFSPYVNFYGEDIILEFLFGCFIAELYLADKLLSNNVAILLLVLSILAILSSYHRHLIPIKSLMKSIQYGIPSAFIVLAVLSLEINRKIKIPAFLTRLGNSSYSIYLTHLSIFLVIFISLFKQIEKYIYIPSDLVVIALWVACVFLGCLVYEYIEKPITIWLRCFNNLIEVKNPLISINTLK